MTQHGKSKECAGRRTAGRDAFTLIEILIGIALSVVTFTAASLLFQAVTVNAKRPATLVDVTLGSVAADNFYGLAQNSISVYTAPSYGRGAFAEEMRERFLEDTHKAVAVFCLGRNVLNTVRPTIVPFPLAGSVRLDTPEAFRTHLNSEFPAATTIFQSYRVVSSATNGTIFVIGPSAVATELPVIAVYEIDFVANANPAGTYASVRRYEGSTLTNYYDIFYPQGAGALFNPLFVTFERDERLDLSEGTAIDRFKQAENYPFYFIWWPDPAALFLESPPIATYSAADPRQAYGHMGGRTSFMFTVPLFPSF